MTEQEIIDLADKAGITFVTEIGVASATVEWLQEFAALVSAREREMLATRQWQGLTYEEIAEAGQLNVEGERMLPYSFARAIEAKLKEKNNA